MVCRITVQVYHRVTPSSLPVWTAPLLQFAATRLMPFLHGLHRSSVRQRRPREEAGGRWRRSLHLPPADEYITLRLLQCQSSPATLQRTESPRTVIREKLRDRKGGFIPFSRRFAGRRPANLQGRAKRRPALKWESALFAERQRGNARPEGPGCLANAKAGIILEQTDGPRRSAHADGKVAISNEPPEFRSTSAKTKRKSTSYFHIKMIL